MAIFNLEPQKAHGKLEVEWIYLNDIVFSDPFFEDTIARCRMINSQNGIAYKGQSSISYLNELSQEIVAIEPSLFIFHTSRSGSTFYQVFREDILHMG